MNLAGIISSPLLLCMAISASFVIKIYLLTLIVPHLLRSSHIKKPWFFLLGILGGSLFGDIAWIIKLTRDIFFNEISYAWCVFFSRLSWAFLIIQYQSLALFLESLTYKKFLLKLRHVPFLVISIGMTLFFLYEAFFDNQLNDIASRVKAYTASTDSTYPEIIAMRYTSIYIIHLLMASSLCAAFVRTWKKPLPTLLKKQLYIVLVYFMFPYLLTEAFQSMQFKYALFQLHLYPLVGASTILIACGSFYCMIKVMGMRFLNIESSREPVQNVHFINNFKNLLEQLSHATNIQELGTLTQTFFHEAFGISPRRTTLIIHHNNIVTQHSDVVIHSTESIVANVLTTNNPEIWNFIKKEHILFYNELEFTNFYEETTLRKNLLTFLQTINASIFIPIYEKNTIIAYIIVEQSLSEEIFFGTSKQNEMLVFINYLGSIINLLQNRSLSTLLHQEQELKNELHAKYQEIGQYKESIKSFLRNSHRHEMGIIFYKNRRFSFGNLAAKNLIGINLNMQERHPLTLAIKKLVNNVMLNLSPERSFAHDIHGKKIVLYGVPNIEKNTIIIISYYPQISDVLTSKLNLLKDPTQWDYLLYLETTQSGQLINQLIPGSGETLLNFKINLLKTALSKKAILLEMPLEDVVPTVEILHHISLRKKLHRIDLKKQTNSTDIIIQWFGLNPLFDPTNTHKPLFTTLHNTGTLFINNIEYLSLEAQSYLAEYLKTGFYRVFKSEEKVPVNVLIIGATQKNLQSLVQSGKFSKDLFDKLNKTSLCMPSLTTLPEQELHKIADEYTEQELKKHTLKNVLQLTDKEKNKLAYNRSVSLHDLKKRIQEILANKAQKNNIYHETTPETIFDSPNSDILITIAQLGKKALRNKNTMALLWNKFHNQNKIAMFLGVNRSSINRRCKEYGLH